MKRALMVVLGCLALFALLRAGPGMAQGTAADAKREADKASDRSLVLVFADIFDAPNVPRLSEQRKRLEAEIASLQAQIEAETRGLSQLRNRASSRRTFYELERAELEQRRQTTKDALILKRLETQTAELNAQLEQAKADAARADELEKGLDAKRTQIVLKKNEALEIERKIDEAININLRILGYRIVLCIVFAMLIGFLIWKFFTVVREDPTVRQAVFSAQSGIQFLTLFCLVIAIFVFGIAGILEGKELSALLGGLSGYILGRVTQSPGAPPAPRADLVAQAKG